MSGRMCNEVYANLDKLYASALEGVTDEGLRLSLLAQAKIAFNIRDVLAMLRYGPARTRRRSSFSSFSRRDLRL
jgi:hypothetical protein